MGKLMKQYLLALLLGIAAVDMSHAAATKFTDLTVTGTLTTVTSATTGNQTVTGNSTVTGNQIVTGNRSLAGQNVLTPSSTTGVFITTTVAASAPYVILTSSSGPLVMTATPTISTTTAVNGQLLILKGVNATNTITLQDQGTLSGSLIELGSTTRVISDKKVLQLIFDSTLGEWLELSYGNN